MWGRAAKGQQEGTAALWDTGDRLLGIRAQGMEVENVGSEYFQTKKSNLFWRLRFSGNFYF